MVKKHDQNFTGLSEKTLISQLIKKDSKYLSEEFFNIGCI